MQDFTAELFALRSRLDEAATYLRITEQQQHRTALETEMADPELWNDQDRGRRVQKDLARVVEDLDLTAACSLGWKMPRHWPNWPPRRRTRA